MPGRLTASLLSFFFTASAFAGTCPVSSAPGSHGQLSSVKCFAARHDWISAEQQIRSYRQAHPRSTEGAMLETQIFMQQKHLIEAGHILDSALALHPHSISLLTLYAELLRKLDQQDRAENLLRQCSRYAPGNAAVWERLGDFHLDKKPKEAILDFRRASALAPQDALPLAGLAAARGDTGKDASADFIKAVSLNTKTSVPNAMVNWLYAEYLESNKNYAAAIAQYNAAIIEDPTLSDAYLGRGRAYAALQKWSDAERDLQVSKKDPKDELLSLIELVRIYRNDGNAERSNNAQPKSHTFQSNNPQLAHPGTTSPVNLRTPAF